jgi:hypothetical protein
MSNQYAEIWNRILNKCVDLGMKTSQPGGNGIEQVLGFIEGLAALRVEPKDIEIIDVSWPNEPEKGVRQFVPLEAYNVLRGKEEPSRIIYLASPYTHEDRGVREYRFRVACRVAARLMRGGHFVFSPIAHSHPIAEAGELPGDFAFWQAYDREWLKASRELIVLQLVGWEKSQGIRGEIEFMQSLGRPVKYIIPEIEDISIAVDIPAPKEIDTPLVSLEVIVDYMATQLGMSYDSIAELLTDYGLEECCWCRENAPAGCKPSFYIKKPEEMSGAVDRELGGHLCKECAAAAEEEERRRAEEGKA